jgi:hypothetical protein
VCAVITRSRAACDEIAGAAYDDLRVLGGTTRSVRRLAVRRIDAGLAASWQRCVACDHDAGFEDLDSVDQAMDFEHAAVGGVGDAVAVAADADHALVRDPPLQLEHAAVGCQRHRPQHRAFLSERLIDHTFSGRVGARVGHRIEPVTQLDIEVFEIAEAAGEEEILADVAERPLDLPLGLGAIWAAGLRLEAKMPRQIDQASVVDDQAVGVLADHRGLHAVIEDLPRCAADGGKGGDMATQHGLQVLVDDEAAPDQPREAEHHGKQPDDARDTGLIGECDLEAGEVDLRLLTGRRLEADLEALCLVGPESLHRALHRGVAADEAPLAQLPQQPDRGQARIGGHTLAQVRQKIVRATWPPWLGPIGWRLQSASNVFAYRLTVDAELAGDRGWAQPLPV